MIDLVEELYLTNRALVTPEYDECLEHIDGEVLPLSVHEYDSGTEFWGSWIVPQQWSVEEAYIERDGERILDYEDHPLHLIAYSEPFEGTLSREELVEHIYTHGSLEDAIPWHFRQQYRPWDGEWGFCARQTFVDELEPGEYDVTIDTRFRDGTMKVAEHHLEGSSDRTIVFAAHLDHTGMANDDLAGVAVGCELMQRLAELDSRRYSYKLLIVPELLGSVAYLASQEKEVKTFAAGIFLEMPGNDNRLLLQRSFDGSSTIDRVAEHVLRMRGSRFEIGEFREHIGNDELIFEAPGFEVPMISLNRFPYEQYHTQLDSPEIISEERMQSYCDAILDTVHVLEEDFVPSRTFDGVPSLANPRYDLYLDADQVLDRADKRPDEDGPAPDAFRNRVFRYLDGDYSAFDIAAEFGLEFEFVRDYLREFEEVGLIDTKPAWIELPRPDHRAGNRDS